MKKKCLDTYALVEISEANPNFVKYLSEDFVITEIILAEFYAVLLRRFGEKTAFYWFKKLQPYSVKVDLNTFIEAVTFREKNKKKRISFFDAVGYMFSIKNDYFFVTGDKEFKDLKNVEFKKKNV